MCVYIYIYIYIDLSYPILSHPIPSHPILSYPILSYPILLQNMVGPGEVDADLEPETAEECQKYGKVARCVIHEVSGVLCHPRGE